MRIFRPGTLRAVVAMHPNAAVFSEKFSPVKTERARGTRIGKEAFLNSGHVIEDQRLLDGLEKFVVCMIIAVLYAVAVRIYKLTTLMDGRNTRTSVLY